MRRQTRAHGRSEALITAAVALLSAFPAGSEPHPFVYLGQGNSVREGWQAVWIWFRDDVPAARIEALIPEAPLPLSATASRDAPFFRAIGRRALRVNSDDFLQDYVRIAYNDQFARRLRLEGLDAAKRYFRVHALVEKLFEDGGEDRYPSDAEWAAYHRDVDRWLQSVHARHPIAFVLKTGNLQGDPPSPWNAWSVRHAGTEVLPRLAEFFRAQRGTVLKLSAEDVDDHFAARVQELLRYVLDAIVPTLRESRDPAAWQAIAETVEPALGYRGRQKMDRDLRRFLELAPP